MEIKSIDPYKTQQLERNAESREAGKLKAGQREQAQAANSGGADRISLSPEARLHATAVQAANSAPDVRADKVASLKAKVETGEYQVNSRDIASKLLQEEQEIFGA